MRDAKLGNSVEGAAQRLGVGRDKIYRLIRDQQLEARKIGKRTIITEEALLKCLAQLPTLKLPA